jgi:hypothetical protein
MRYGVKGQPNTWAKFLRPVHCNVVFFMNYTLAQTPGELSKQPNPDAGGKAVLGVGMGVLWLVFIFVLLLTFALLPRFFSKRREQG